MTAARVHRPGPCSLGTEPPRPELCCRSFTDGKTMAQRRGVWAQRARTGRVRFQLALPAREGRRGCRAGEGGCF